MPKDYEGFTRQEVGTAVRKLRESKGWTPGKLSAESGVNHSNLNDFEVGSRDMGLDTVSALATALECESINDLIARADKLPPHVSQARLGKAVRRLREHAGMSPVEFSELMGVNDETLRRLEHNVKPVSALSLVRLPAIFGCQSEQEILDKAAALPRPIKRTAIGKAVREEREKHHMTQRDLADEIGVSDSAINGLENTGTQLGRKHIFKLPKVFGYESLHDMVHHSPNWSEQVKNSPRKNPHGGHSK